MDAARELAQLLGGARQLRGRLVEQRGRLPGSPSSFDAREPQRQRERDEPLLRAVVEVALEPAALVVGRPATIRARELAQLLDLRPQLSVEPLVLERERRRGADRPDQLRSARSSAASWTIAATGSPSRSTGTRPRRAALAATRPARPAAST